MQGGQGKGNFDWFQVESHRVRSRQKDKIKLLQLGHVTFFVITA